MTFIPSVKNRTDLNNDMRFSFLHSNGLSSSFSVLKYLFWNANSFDTSVSHEWTALLLLLFVYCYYYIISAAWMVIRRFYLFILINFYGKKVLQHIYFYAFNIYIFYYYLFIYWQNRAHLELCFCFHVTFSFKFISILLASLESWASLQF